MEYNSQKMFELLRDFYLLTGIKICIYDKSENEIAYYPEKHSGFCTLIRKDELLNKKCIECDKHAFEQCKKTKKQYTYTCHAGLLECISPIVINDEIIGYVALGQVPSNIMPKNLNNNFLAEYNKLPKLPVEKLSAAINILDACAGYQYLKDVMSHKDGIEYNIEEYIRTHLSCDIQDLLREFNVSRNQLYSIFKNYFNTTPHEYIKEKKINKALTLLENTKLPVNEIAVKCGIPDYNYFSKVFKKTVGISPTEYRKNQ